MADKPETKCIATHEQICHGETKDRQYAFPDDPVKIIVKAYDNGQTIPVCRFLEDGCVAARCNPTLKPGVTVQFAEDDLGVCHWRTYF